MDVTSDSFAGRIEPHQSRGANDLCDGYFDVVSQAEYYDGNADYAQRPRRVSDRERTDYGVGYL